MTTGMNITNISACGDNILSIKLRDVHFRFHIFFLLFHISFLICHKFFK